MSEIIQFPQREQPKLPPVSDVWLDRQAARRCSQIEVAAYSVAALAATASQKAKASVIARLAASLADEFNDRIPPGDDAA